MHFSIPDTKECKDDTGSTFLVSCFFINILYGLV